MRIVGIVTFQRSQRLVRGHVGGAVIGGDYAKVCGPGSIQLLRVEIGILHAIHRVHRTGGAATARKHEAVAKKQSKTV